MSRRCLSVFKKIRSTQELDIKKEAEEVILDPIL